MRGIVDSLPEVSILVLSRADLEGMIEMREASDAMAVAFGALSEGRAVAPERMHLDVAGQGKTLLMGAHVPGLGLATKIVSYFAGNTGLGLPAANGVVSVLDEQTGCVRALCDGTYLTRLRTAAGTCLATRLLARADACVGALIGIGGQAPLQLEAMAAARDLTRINVFARNRDKGKNFIASSQSRVGVELVLMDEVNDAVKHADIVVCATNSASPVFRSSSLKEGAHVNGIGSFTPAMCEVDSDLIARARIFVDSVAGAASEAGELMLGLERGYTQRADWTEIGRVASGISPGRRSAKEITFYKSVGHAVQDVAIARLALQRAMELGRGTRIEL